MAYTFRSNGYVRFVRANSAAWESLNTKDVDTLYFISEANASTGKLYLGNKLISGDVTSSFSLNDLTDVLLTSGISSNQLLVYDRTINGGTWVNKSVNEVFQEISTSIMVGADADTNGIAGLVPAPTAGQENLFLRGDATWADPTATLSATVSTLNSTVSNLNTSVSTLIGVDNGMSVREIANAQVATIVANAPQEFDTLKEIADWISGHQDALDLTQLQTAVSNLQATVNGMPAVVDPDTGEEITPAAPGLVTKVNTLETSMTTVQSNISNLQSVTNTLNLDVADLKDRMSDAEDAIDGLDTRLKWQDLVEE